MISKASKFPFVSPAMAMSRRAAAILVTRLIALIATFIAAVVMATSHEKGTIFGAISYEAKYSDTPAFKYFVIANVVATIYGFLVLFLPSESPLWRLVLVFDLVLTMLLVSSISAALAIAEVGKKGNSHAGWLPVCNQIPKYCRQTTAALVAGFVGLVLYFLLVCYSIHHVLDPFLIRKN